MNDSQGHVTVNELMPSARFHRFVEEKVQEWILDHEIQASDAGYEVAFFDEETLGETSCLVVIQSGSHLWRSWETADNPRLALDRSLEHLREDGVDDNDQASGLDESQPLFH